MLELYVFRGLLQNQLLIFLLINMLGRGDINLLSNKLICLYQIGLLLVPLLNESILVDLVARAIICLLILVHLVILVD